MEVLEVVSICWPIACCCTCQLIAGQVLLLLVLRNVLLQVQDAQDLCSMGSCRVELSAMPFHNEWCRLACQLPCDFAKTSPAGNAWPGGD